MDTPTKEAVFVYVLDGESYLNKTHIDLNSNNNEILDIGGITSDINTAREWQFTKEDSNASDQIMKNLIFDRVII